MKNNLLFITILISTVLLTPDISYAQNFVPLVDIPFINELNIQQQNLGLAGYANSLYRAAITIAAVLAVIKIVMAGVQYMLTDVVPQKSEAKKNIKNALLGLTIVVGAVLILNTVNPSLTNLEVLNLKQLEGDLGDVNVGTVGTSIVEEAFPDGYEIKDCTFFRTELSCKSWCENRSGIFIEKGWQFNLLELELTNTGTHQCVVALETAAACRATTAGSESCTESNCDGEWTLAEDGFYECRGNLTTTSTPEPSEINQDDAVSQAISTGRPVYADEEKTKPLVCTDDGRDRCFGQCASLGGRLTPVSRDPLIAKCNYQ